MPVSGVKFINVQTGSEHSLALTDSGDIYSWGSNYYGQLGLGTSGSGTNKDTPQKVTVNGVKFTDIAVGVSHSLALTDTGVLYSWGVNEYGQLGLGTSGTDTNKTTPQRIWAIAL